MDYRSFVQKHTNQVKAAPLLLAGIVALVTLAAAIFDLTTAAYMDMVIMFVISGVMWYIFAKELPFFRFKKYLKEVEKLGQPEQIFSHLETLKPNIFAEGVDLRFDEAYVAYVGAGEAFLKSAGELVWGYLYDEIVSRKLGGIIPIGQVRQRGVMLRFSDGSGFVVRLAREDACIDVLEELKVRYAYMMMGYEPQLEAVYQNNPKELWIAAGYQNERP